MVPCEVNIDELGSKVGQVAALVLVGDVIHHDHHSDSDLKHPNTERSKSKIKQSRSKAASDCEQGVPPSMCANVHEKPGREASLRVAHLFLAPFRRLNVRIEKGDRRRSSL